MTSGLDRAQLEDEGYTIVELAGAEQQQALQALIDRFATDPHHGFFASPYHANGPEARRFDLGAREVLGDRLSELLPDHVPFLAGVTSKGGQEGASVRFHHDWTYTDERRARVVFFWCPLVDVGPENGGLAVVPGSHRWLSGIRPSRTVEATEPLQAEIASMAVDLRLSAGQAIAFDPAVLHGSGPNPTPSPRPAFTIAVAPRDEALLHFHLDDTGRLGGAVVDDAFFTLHPYRAAPVGYPTYSPWTDAVTEDDVRDALARAGATGVAPT